MLQPQNFYIYPEKLANQAKEILTSDWGWSEEDYNSYFELASELENRLNHINATLIDCNWRTEGNNGEKTIWGITISTPGHCDIFQLLQVIRETWDLNGIDDHFSFIDTQGQIIKIEFTFCA